MRRLEKEVEKEISYYAGKEKKIRFKFATVKCDRTNLETFINLVERGDVKAGIIKILKKLKKNLKIKKNIL